MADRLSLGPVQVFGNDVLSINEALRQLSERIDELKGLRGRTLIYDRVRADDPTENQDALVYPNIYSDHGALNGLTDDDHSQYLLLAGRAPSQTVAGTFSSTGAWTVSSVGSLTKDEGLNGTTKLARFPMGEISINGNAVATVITTLNTFTLFDETTALTVDSYLFDSPQGCAEDGICYPPLRKRLVFTLGGGGNTFIDFQGSCVVYRIRMNGHFKFHYDENLRNVGPGRGYIATNCMES